MKLHKVIIMMVLAFAFCMVAVNAAEVQSLALISGDKVTFCHDPNILKAFKIIATVILVARILVPVFVVITGIKSMAGAVLAEDDSAIKKSASMLLVKIIVGACVFFVPSVVYAIMDVAHGYDKTTSQFTQCGKCLTSTKTCDKLITQYSK